ncbi:MAG: hypothetical protein QOJ92_1010 [Frankiales bacterium]|nr:hypothetical protein [Frankiales bacterium]
MRARLLPALVGITVLGAGIAVGVSATAAKNARPTVAYHGKIITAQPKTRPANRAVAYRGRPLVLQQTYVGRGAAEPTIGLDKSGTAFYAASTFDSVVGQAHTILLRSKDTNKTWKSVQPTAAGADLHPQTLDPYVYVDPDFGRVFNVDLVGAASEISFSDDKGATWSHTVVSSAGVNDHQTLTFGFPPRESSYPLLDPKLPKIGYYCGNTVAFETCARSFDGGLSWSQLPSPPYTGASTQPGGSGFCGSLAGHLVTDPIGNVYMPKGHCDLPTIAISSDAGTTWKDVPVSTTIHASDIQTSVSSDKAGNLFYVWWDSVYQLPYLSVSRDHGNTWSPARMIAPPEVTQVNFPTIEAGDRGRIAISFPGTTGDPRDPNRPWNTYVVISTDALTANPTFVSSTSNIPSDPVHRGNCNARCAGMFDFLDVVVAPAGQGVVWATATDTCTSAACKDPDGSARSASDAAGVAVRQVSGPALRGKKPYLP